MKLICVLPVLVLLCGPRAAGLDHAPFDRLLRAHVTEGGVDYRGLGRDAEGLGRYIRSLGDVELAGTSRAQRLALYINAYNACTLQTILRHYGRINAITEIEEKFGYHPWKHKQWRIAGETLSLDAIEHEKLRGQLVEPRIHFAVNCASDSCPDLWHRAYTAERIEAQLDAAARRFFADTGKGLRLERATGALHISRLFKWFADDFGQTVPERIAFASRYAPPDLAPYLRQNRERLGLVYMEYSWDLNDSH